jgi:hypothetical protein
MLLQTGSLMGVHLLLYSILLRYIFVVLKSSYLLFMSVQLIFFHRFTQSISVMQRAAGGRFVQIATLASSFGHLLSAQA